MNILQEIIKSQGGNVVGQLADQFGLSQEDAQKALTNLIPVVAGGIKKQAQSQSGLEALLDKVNNNREVRKSIDQPDILGTPEATARGNEILGDIFGSKEVSRNVADKTANVTGLDFTMLKKMLPLVAGVVMSSLNKKSSGVNGGLGGLLGSLAGAAMQPKRNSGLLGGLLGSLMGGGRKQRQTSGLESLLDFDGDGSVADEMLDLAKKMF